MELILQEVEVIVDKVTFKIYHFPKHQSSDQEILQFDEILARNSSAPCPQENSTKGVIMPTVKLEGLYEKKQ